MARVPSAVTSRWKTPRTDAAQVGRQRGDDPIGVLGEHARDAAHLAVALARSAPCAGRRARPRAWRRANCSSGSEPGVAASASTISRQQRRRSRSCSRAARRAPPAPRAAPRAASGCRKWRPRDELVEEPRDPRRRDRGSRSASTTSTRSGAAASSAAPDEAGGERAPLRLVGDQRVELLELIDEQQHLLAASRGARAQHRAEVAGRVAQLLQPSVRRRRRAPIARRAGSDQARPGSAAARGPAG